MQTQTTIRAKRYFARFRSLRMSASQALRSAKTVDEFERYERLGLARIRVEADEHADYEDLECNCGNKHCRHNEILQRDGAYGTIGEYRLDENNNEWEHADSCWGHVGYDDAGSPWENYYVIDHMAACIEALESNTTHNAI